MDQNVFPFIERIPKCESQPCQNGGTCVENEREDEGFYCKCLEKYQGNHCQGTKSYSYKFMIFQEKFLFTYTSKLE